MQRRNAVRVPLRITLLAFLWGVIPYVGHAQGEQIPWSVVGSGGIIGGTDGTAIMSATVGQAIIGPVNDGTYLVSQGFWLPIVNPSSVDIEARITGAFRLRNYPNPFSTTTTIAYQLDEPSTVNLQIVDLLGNRITTLVENVEEAGEHAAVWDGMTARGGRAGGGVYLYVLTVQPTGQDASSVRTERRKLVLVR